MAGSAFDYVKNLWNSMTNASENKTKYDKDRESLENFMKEQEKLYGAPEKPKLPDVPDYDKIDYKPPTDEELKKQAEAGLKEQEILGKNSIEKEIEELNKKYNKDKDTLASSKEQKSVETVKAYEDAAESTDNDVLKRGIARSSIAANQKSELEKSKAETLSRISDKYLGEISSIDSEINGLGAKREKALNDFNIAYAAKLTEKINELTGTREKKIEDALKYNNTITEKQSDAEIDKIMKESDLYNDLLNQREKENGMSGSKDSPAMYKANYGEMKKLLKGMNPIEARDAILKDSLFKDNLDSYYYYMLVDEFGR